MIITEWLKLDHALFRVSLREIQLALLEPDPEGASQIRRVLKGLLEALRGHEEIENELLFPALRKHSHKLEPALIDAFRSGHKELHEKVDSLLDALDLSAPLSRVVAASNFIVILREHLDEEEGILFPTVERLLPGMVQEELTEQAKARVQARKIKT